MASKKKVKKSSMPLSAPVITPGHVSQIERLMDLDERSEADWRKIQLHLDSLHKLISTSLYERKTFTNKERGGLTIILNLLKETSRPPVVSCIIKILDVLCDHKYKLKLVNLDVVKTLFVSFARLSKDQGKSLSPLQVEYITVLLKLAPKDKTFATKGRLAGILPVVYSLMVHNFQMPTHCVILVQVLRALVTSSTNVGMLQSLGATALLNKVLQKYKLRDLTVVKCTADTLASLLKQGHESSKSAQSVLKALIPLMEELYRLDKQKRHVGVLQAVVSCFKVCIQSNSHLQETVRNGHTFLVLYEMAKEFSKENIKEQSDISGLACQILKICLPYERVEIPCFENPLSYPLPKPVEVDAPEEPPEGYTCTDSSREADKVEESEGQTSEGQTVSDESQHHLITKCTSSPSFSVNTLQPGQYSGEVPFLEPCDELYQDNEENPDIPDATPGNSFKSGIDDMVTIFSDIPVQSDTEDPLTLPVDAPTGNQQNEGSVGLGESCLQDNTSCSHQVSNEYDLQTFDSFFPELELSEEKSVLNDTITASNILLENNVVTNTSCSTFEGEDAVFGLVEGKGDQSLEEVYSAVSTSPRLPVKSVDNFTHMPPFVRYKDCRPSEPEAQVKGPFNLEKMIILHNVERYLNAKTCLNKVIYDNDEVLNGSWTPPDPDLPHAALQFDARFECGNLRKVVWVRDNEYDIQLNSDINSDHHHQWFCFKITGMQTGVPYLFNIVNCEKPKSQFKHGMQPVMFSVKDAETGNQGWKRVGKDVSYYVNKFKFMEVRDGNVLDKPCRTATFTITFPHSEDTCYLAYHYPYLYSDLMSDLSELEDKLDSTSVYYKRHTLCHTISGNDCPLLTITSTEDDPTAYLSKEYVVLSARVHPGETNSSWIMRGVVKFLLSGDVSANLLRQKYIFKVIPMLNPDGVINGSHRCSLAGNDLNRRWLNPDPLLHPTIYHAKGILHWLSSKHKPSLLYVDFHGHSQIKNVVLYGCPDPSGGTVTEDFPKLLSSVAPAFSLKGCTYKMEKNKEGAARIVVWRMGVVRSYTMESSYCGASQGKYKGLQFGMDMLEEMGRHFCDALLLFKVNNLSVFPLAEQEC